LVLKIFLLERRHTGLPWPLSGIHAVLLAAPSAMAGSRTALDILGARGPQLPTPTRRPAFDQRYPGRALFSSRQSAQLASIRRHSKPSAGPNSFVVRRRCGVGWGGAVLGARRQLSVGDGGARIRETKWCAALCGGREIRRGSCFYVVVCRGWRLRTGASGVSWAGFASELRGDGYFELILMQVRSEMDSTPEVRNDGP